mmetsp:Transcript_38039/g.47137  ORF Transcript_38039/g.47137 Transcript_38039/m.47137 type:complete len:166 (+) Transcript_38039:367-864(+)
MAENAEWGNVHWSERHYTAKLGDIVNRQRPDEVKQLMESSKPPIHKPGLNSIKPVQAGGPAYPIFYNPNNKEPGRSHANIPKDKEGRRGRVVHIHSLHKATGVDYSECAMEYDMVNGQYSYALERIRDKQVYKLSNITGKSKDECKKMFDKYLGNYNKALQKLRE